MRCAIGLTADMLAIFETGIRYHFIHALALFVVAWAGVRWPGPLVGAAGWLFVAGILIFSGSLYALSNLRYPLAGRDHSDWRCLHDRRLGAAGGSCAARFLGARGETPRSTESGEVPA